MDPEEQTQTPMPFTSDAYLRAQLSCMLTMLADRALYAAATDRDHQREPGTRDSLVAEVAELTGLIGGIMDCAVAVEREQGVTWAKIGKPLRLSRQGALKKFGGHLALGAWQEFRDYHYPNDSGDRKPHTPATRHRAAKAAAHLAEAALRRRTAAYDSWSKEPYPVTGHLSRHTPSTLLQALNAYETVLVKAYADPDPHELADIAERRADVYELLSAPESAKQERWRAVILRRRPAGAVAWRELPSETTGL